jgi:hypothetical protein
MANEINEETTTMYDIPNEPHDVRFEITALEEPEMGATHIVREIELVLNPADERWPCETVTIGEEIDRHITDNPYGMVEAFREYQACPDFEERMEREHEREQRERA